MNTKHTPGPWTHSEVFDGNDESCGISISAERVEVARIHGVGFVDFYNAKLIAAAPDLLRELEHLVRLLDPYIEQISVPGLATLNGALAAIEKATS